MNELTNMPKAARSVPPRRSRERRVRPSGARPTVPLAERMAGLAIWALMLAAVARETLGETELVGFGFYTLHVVDPAVVLTFLAWGLYQLQRAPRGGPIVPPALLIAALLLLNFARGLVTDSAAALLWARGTLELAGLLLLALTCGLTARLHANIRRALVTAAVLIAGLAVLRAIFGISLFMTTSNVDAINGANDSNRAIAMGGAFVLGLATVMLFSELLQEGVGRAKAKAAGATTLLLVEAASGQGTATIATLAMLLAVAMLERGGLRGVRAVTVLVGIGLLAVVFASGAFTGLAETGGENLRQRAGNFETRQNVWAGLMAVFPTLPLTDQVLGLPGGQIPYIIVTAWHDPVVWRLSMHSMYFGALPMMGYAGLAAFVALLVVLIVDPLRAMLTRSRAAIMPAYPLAFGLGTAILSVSYELRNETAIGLFIAMWWVRRARAPGMLRLGSRFVRRPGAEPLPR